MHLTSSWTTFQHACFVLGLIGYSCGLLYFGMLLWIWYAKYIIKLKLFLFGSTTLWRHHCFHNGGSRGWSRRFLESPTTQLRAVQMEPDTRYRFDSALHQTISYIRLPSIHIVTCLYLSGRNTWKHCNYRCCYKGPTLPQPNVFLRGKHGVVWLTESSRGSSNHSG